MSEKLTRKELAEKLTLRNRLIDMARGAGIDEPEQGDYWCFTMKSMSRFVCAVVDTFQEQSENLGNDELLCAPWNLRNYECVNDLVDFLYRLGYRA